MISEIFKKWQLCEILLPVHVSSQQIGPHEVLQAQILQLLFGDELIIVVDVFGVWFLEFFG